MYNKCEAIGKQRPLSSIIYSGSGTSNFRTKTYPGLSYQIPMQRVVYGVQGGNSDSPVAM